MHHLSVALVCEVERVHFVAPIIHMHNMSRALLPMPTGGGYAGSHEFGRAAGGACEGDTGIPAVAQKMHGVDHMGNA